MGHLNSGHGQLKFATKNGGETMLVKSMARVLFVAVLIGLSSLAIARSKTVTPRLGFYFGHLVEGGRMCSIVLQPGDPHQSLLNSMVDLAPQAFSLDYVYSKNQDANHFAPFLQGEDILNCGLQTLSVYVDRRGVVKSYELTSCSDHPKIVKCQLTLWAK